MQKDKKLEIILILVGILALGLIIHSIYKNYRKNYKTHNTQTINQTQLTNNVIAI